MERAPGCPSQRRAAERRLRAQGHRAWRLACDFLADTVVALCSRYPLAPRSGPRSALATSGQGVGLDGSGRRRMGEIGSAQHRAIPAAISGLRPPSMSPCPATSTAMEAGEGHCRFFPMRQAVEGSFSEAQADFVVPRGPSA